MEFVGLEPGRIKLDWVSASEGDRYSKIVTEFTETIRELGPSKWKGDRQGGEIKLSEEQLILEGEG
jgi:coenzyme F420-reducing hydrogenase delta subunit